MGILDAEFDARVLHDKAAAKKIKKKPITRKRSRIRGFSSIERL
jgi:hypothetical protein